MVLLQASLQISAFGEAFLFILGASIFVAFGLFVVRLISPNRPNPEKLSTYECGEDPVGHSGLQFNNRFYVVALVFLIFEVEILFLFPWATVFAEPGIIEPIRSWGWLALIEMTLFVVILLVGLAYVWRKGDLKWIKPDPIVPIGPESAIPNKYDLINKRYEGTVDNKRTAIPQN
ncbi:MAG: NADH-quinone oxidoreductase subunit A [Bacteroidota bacterium]